jgi:uncharacterized protein YdeI (YjbR/CyaY-like superfamily)
LGRQIFSQLRIEAVMITQIEDYFSKGCGRCPRFNTPDCSTRRWSAGLADLRRICRAAGLLETVKWGHPCYMLGDRNIALIGAFRDDFRLTFMNASLMSAPESVLEKRGPNTRHPDMIRFTDNAQVLAMEPIITAYLQESIGYARAGVKPVKEASDIELQSELVEALDSDPEFSEAFHSLTPGRQRSYVIHLGSTEIPATRVARIERFRGKVLAGKGWNER